MSTITLWEWRQDVALDPGQLVGFGVEAQDGSIGKIDEVTSDVGASYVVINTGPWIFGKKVLIPASMIDRVDYDTETAYVMAMKEQIKNAPEFDESTYRDPSYRDRVGEYYGHR